MTVNTGRCKSFQQKNKKRYNEDMSFSPIYLLQRFLYRIFMFFYNWYVSSFGRFADFFLGVFQSLDVTFALKVNIQHWFDPLYQQRNIVGYFLGFIFRTIRIFSGTIIYLLIFLFSVALYLAWAAIPFVIIWYGVS